MPSAAVRLLHETIDARIDLRVPDSVVSRSRARVLSVDRVRRRAVVTRTGETQPTNATYGVLPDRLVPGDDVLMLKAAGAGWYIDAILGRDGAYPAVIDVREHMGAAWDGTTDDTAAIGAAIALGGAILLPPGVGIVSQPIPIPGSTVILGHGTGGVSWKPGTLLPYLGGVLQPSTGQSGILIDGVIVDGNADASPRTPTAYYAALVRIDADDVELRDCTFRNGSWGVLINDALRPRIDRCHFEDIDYHAFNVSCTTPNHPTNGVIERCTFTDIGQHGIILVNSGGWTIFDGNALDMNVEPSMRVNVDPNYLDSTASVVTHHAPSGFPDFTELRSGNFLIVARPWYLPFGREIFVDEKVSTSVLHCANVPTFTIADALAVDNVIYCTGAHGLSQDMTVVFTALTGGAGLAVSDLAATSPTNVYYVIASGLTSTEFRVSTTLGGAQVDITGDYTDGGGGMILRNTAAAGGVGDIINVSDGDDITISHNRITGGMSAGILPWANTDALRRCRVIGNQCHGIGGAPIAVQSYSVEGVLSMQLDGNMVTDSCINDPAIGVGLAFGYSFYGSGPIDSVWINGGVTIDDQGAVPGYRGQMQYWLGVFAGVADDITLGSNYSARMVNAGTYNYP